MFELFCPDRPSAWVSHKCSLGSWIDLTQSFIAKPPHDFHISEIFFPLHTVYVWYNTIVFFQVMRDLRLLVFCMFFFLTTMHSSWAYSIKKKKKCHHDLAQAAPTKTKLKLN